MVNKFLSSISATHIFIHDKIQDHEIRPVMHCQKVKFECQSLALNIRQIKDKKTKEDESNEKETNIEHVLK